MFVSADPGAHAEQIDQLAELGFDEIYLHHVGQTQDRFIEVFGERVLPQLDVWPKAAPMRITETSDLWWKTAIIYCLDVETYLDWNDDGLGDFPGLAQRLDYLSSLGVTCLWLMPFYPSPDRDDGYDIVDFYGVDPRLWILGDLVEVIRTARDRGMRVIADLVVNHTSDKHPGSRRPGPDRNSKYRDFYVWSDDPPIQAHRPSRRSRTRRRASGPSTSRPASTTCTASTSTSRT